MAVVFTPPIDTNRYSHLMIKYKNAVENVRIAQILTLRNDTTKPNFIINLYIPVSQNDSFTFFITQLPENQTINKIELWMRNKDKTTGKIRLDIDYIGFVNPYY